MGSIIDYSSYVCASYVVSGLVFSALAGFIGIRYISVKVKFKKLDEKESS